MLKSSDKAFRESSLRKCRKALRMKDPAAFCAALGSMSRHEGMTGISNRIGANRTHLYRGLSETGNPSFATVLKILSVLGLKLYVMPDSPKN